MLGPVRWLLRRLVAVHQRSGRLTPNVLATVLGGLLLSSFATDWMGVKYIFGAFLFGVVMPRGQGATAVKAATALRDEILDRLEQISVLVLLPVFFVVSGLSVNLSAVGLSGLTELGLILLVAIAGKFGGAFVGASLAGVRSRRAGVLATLMNTRGLTELVILSVGLQLHILDQSLYSLMVVMAIVTTMMSGPLLHFIYPEKFVAHDNAEADRAALGTPAEHRILVLVEAPETAAPLVDIGAALAASRERSQLILCQWSAGKLQALADRALARGVPEVVQSRLSRDIATELSDYVATVKPDTIVLGPTGLFRETLAVDGTVQLVTVLRSLPDTPAAVAVLRTRGESGAAAVQVAAQLAVADQMRLVISPAGGRRAGLAAGLTRDGIAASDGPPPSGSIVVAAAADHGDPHLLVRAGIREGSDDLDQWVQDLDTSRLIGQR